MTKYYGINLMKPNAQKEAVFRGQKWLAMTGTTVWKRNVQLWPEILGCLSQGSNSGLTADLDLENDDEGGNEGEEEVGVNDKDEEDVIDAAGAAAGSEPDSEADSAGNWTLTLNYLI